MLLKNRLKKALSEAKNMLDVAHSLTEGKNVAHKKIRLFFKAGIGAGGIEQRFRGG